MADEVLMAIPKSDALHQAELMLLGQIKDGQGRQERAIETVQEHLQEVRERVIKIETQDVADRLKQLGEAMDRRLEQVQHQCETAAAKLRSDAEARVREVESGIKAVEVRAGALEALQTRSAGRAALFELFMRFAPWVAVAVALLRHGGRG